MRVKAKHGKWETSPHLQRRTMKTKNFRVSSLIFFPFSSPKKKNWKIFFCRERRRKRKENLLVQLPPRDVVSWMGWDSSSYFGERGEWWRWCEGWFWEFRGMMTMIERARERKKRREKSEKRQQKTEKTRESPIKIVCWILLNSHWIE